MEVECVQLSLVPKPDRRLFDVSQLRVTASGTFMDVKLIDEGRRCCWTHYLESAAQIRRSWMFTRGLRMIFSSGSQQTRAFESPLCDRSSAYVYKATSISYPPEINGKCSSSLDLRKVLAEQALTS